MHKWGARIIRIARIVITRDGKRSVFVRDWLEQLNFRVGEANKKSQYYNAVNNINNQNNFIEKLKQTFLKIFTRKGKIKGHQIKIEFKKKTLR